MCQCLCQWGPDCIVKCRASGIWVYEDDVLRFCDLPLRPNCLAKPTTEQSLAMVKHGALTSDMLSTLQKQSIICVNSMTGEKF